MSTPDSRVSEFLRQWTLPAYKSGRGDEIYGVHFDPSTDEPVSLTVSDLEDVLAELEELRAEKTYLAQYTEENVQEQGIRVLDHDGLTAIGLKGGQTVEFHTAGDHFIRVAQTDDAQGLEISAPYGPSGHNIWIRPVSSRAVIAEVEQ